MPLTITNPKISIALVEELASEVPFQSVKAYSATYTFLSKVVRIGKDQVFAHIPATKIKEWFEVHGVKYKPILDILVAHDIIAVDRQYIVGSKTRGYRLTDKGAGLMYSCELQYLKKLFQDSKIRRKLQKSASYRKNEEPNYKNPFLQYIHNGRVNYTFDIAAVEYIENSDWPVLTKLKATTSLTDFKRKNFVELKHNESDGRCYNEFVGMKSELRRFFSIGQLHYRYAIDIRSCHPLFLAHFLLAESEPMGYNSVHPFLRPALPIRRILRDERSISSSYPISTPIPSLPTTNPIPNNPALPSLPNNNNPHYDGGNSDILPEFRRWNALFSDPDTDPRAVLIRDLGYTRDQAKAALNQTINGSKQYRKFLKWFKLQFPQLFAVWNRTHRAEVGIGISSCYETRLMQNMGLYELAERLGLHLTYEYDGCGVMCRDDDADVLGKIGQLIAYIGAESERRWGIRPVVVVKTAGGEPVDVSRPRICPSPGVGQA